MAEFTWKKGDITVKQGDRLLCNLQYQRNWYNLATWWQPQFNASSFGGLSTELLLFNNRFNAELALISSKLTVSETSPFANLNLGQPIFTLEMNRLDITAGVPEVIGAKLAFS